MTDALLEQIKADREIGTQGIFHKTSDHEWHLDTGGENTYFVVAGKHGPFAVVAVEQAWGMDAHNEADMRRVCAIPDMEARILRDADTIRELVAALIAVEKSTDTRRQGAIATTALIAFHAKQEAH